MVYGVLCLCFALVIQGMLHNPTVDTTLTSTANPIPYPTDH